MAALPRITDPVYQPIASPGLLDRYFLSLINDPRDLPIVRLLAIYAVTTYPAAAAVFALKNIWLGALYFFLHFTIYQDRCILMLHNTSHRVLFKPKYRLLNSYIPWVMGAFFGEPAVGYFSHHLGMHHVENNRLDDLSTTMPFQRDRFTHFLSYWGWFMVSTAINLPRYLIRKNRSKLAYKTLFGEFGFYVAAGLLLWLVPVGTFFVFVLPFLVVRFLMMWGNWGQHAFVDPARPGNSYANSITCINTRYNRRCFNDGYHIGHHLKQNRHFSEMPGELQAHVETYLREGAIVFDGIDFFQVSLYLFLGRYDWLAKHYVALAEKRPSEAEIIALLKSRTQPILDEQAEPIAVSG
jgi:fatty acid desaturase